MNKNFLAYSFFIQARHTWQKSKKQFFIEDELCTYKKNKIGTKKAVFKIIQDVLQTTGLGITCLQKNIQKLSRQKSVISVKTIYSAISSKKYIYA